MTGVQEFKLKRRTSLEAATIVLKGQLEANFPGQSFSSGEVTAMVQLTIATFLISEQKNMDLNKVFIHLLTACQ